MKPYVVKDGHRFVLPGGQVIEAGGTVHLDAADAERFAARVEPARKRKPETKAEQADQAAADKAKGD